MKCCLLKGFKEALLVLMLCAPVAVGGHFHIIRNGELGVFSCFARFLVKQIAISSEKSIEYGKTVRSINHNVGALLSCQMCT